MRFKAADIGLLVRPKTITHLYLWKSNENIDEWWKQSLNQYRWRAFEKQQQLKTFYKLSLSELFENLHLGNPHTNPEKSYIATINSFIIIHKGSLYHLATKEKAEVFEKEIKKKFGPNAYLPVVAVGLKFFKNLKKTNDNLIADDPWEHTNRDDIIWFYQPKEIVPLENIIKFESINVGNLIILKRIDGIVLHVRSLTKPKFYSANSCVSKSIVILSTNLNYIRLSPDKRFKISL